MPLLIHGLVPASSTGATEDVFDPADDGAGYVCHGGVAAAVRRVESHEVLPSRANLLAHTRVLEALAAATTVLPMRFGMTVDDEEALVTGFLAPQEPALVAALERLEGHVEMRLRGRYDETEVVGRVAATDPAIGRLRRRGGLDARLQLGERIVSGIAARRDQDLDRVVSALRPHVAGVVAGGTAEPLDAFSLSLLVRDDAMDDFDRALDELGRAVAPALALELVGPLPPFSFTAAEAVGA